ncbi:hypothetical protein [Teichococcus oryzae]|uniref:Lipoprotein n=1 Tax=Teichococcus oryzae TaxID=1608942 RepID=A0A5B2THX0_9PROT|nr:hypothetical protein [Pseudoroseomonas oryzae]KAA2213703.1 hypothetical protein F0Q34_06445 [Pseudoroseomonas oryzae]
MRPSLLLVGGLGLMLAACGSPSGPPSGAGVTPLPPGTPSNASSTTSPIQGQDDLGPGRAGSGLATGVPSAGTGRINPTQGSSSQPPRPGIGRPAAQSGTISPIQGQDDRGPGAR